VGGRPGYLGKFFSTKIYFENNFSDAWLVAGKRNKTIFQAN
jgi:hypothetical protein